VKDKPWYAGWEDSLTELYEDANYHIDKIAEFFDVDRRAIYYFAKKKGLSRKYPMKNVISLEDIRAKEVYLDEPCYIPKTKGDNLVVMSYDQYLKLTSNSKQG